MSSCAEGLERPMCPCASARTRAPAAAAGDDTRGDAHLRLAVGGLRLGSAGLRLLGLRAEVTSALRSPLEHRFPPQLHVPYTLLSCDLLTSAALTCSCASSTLPRTSLPRAAQESRIIQTSKPSSGAEVNMISASEHECKLSEQPNDKRSERLLSPNNHDSQNACRAYALPLDNDPCLRNRLNLLEFPQLFPRICSTQAHYRSLSGGRHLAQALCVSWITDRA